MIKVDQGEDGLWTITINRPEKANSLTQAMLADLLDAVVQAQDAKVLVITGVGKVFSAGADLDEARAGKSKSDLWERLSGAIAAHSGMTIAALNGTLAGGAHGMVLACDLRVAVDSSKFFYPVMKNALMPPPSDPARLASLIGPARAKLLLMAGAKITASEALAFGLVDRVTSAENLHDEVLALSADVLAAPSEIAQGIKALCTPAVS